MKATVLIPTFDHGPTLRISLASALAQTVDDIEVLVVGDGAPEETGRIVASFGDPRVRWLPHPKGPRHGEIYRHQALQEARGDVVCYLGDDDIWLPHHVASMRRVLEVSDFANTVAIFMGVDGGAAQVRPVDLAQDVCRRRILGYYNALSLSCCGHTLDFYRRLPHGWQTTPEHTPTDQHMWRQFLSHPDCRAASSFRPTVLHFANPPRADWPIEARVAELQQWYDRIQDASLVEALKTEAQFLALRAGAHAAAELSLAAEAWQAQKTELEALRRENEALRDKLTKATP